MMASPNCRGGCPDCSLEKPCYPCSYRAGKGPIALAKHEGLALALFVLCPPLLFLCLLLRSCRARLRRHRSAA